VIAAGVGGYVAQSHRQAELPTVEAQAARPSANPDASAASVAAASTTSTAAASVPEAGPVSAKTSAPLEAAAVAPVEAVEAASASTPTVKKPSAATKVSPERAARAAPARQPVAPDVPRAARVAAAAPLPSAPPARTAEPAPAVEMSSPEPPTVAEAPPASPAEPIARPQAKVSIADTFVVPADSVIGLELEHSVSSETAQLEDRVDARVTRDVKIDGTTVIPAGSRVRGAVTRVENGGRFKERGRIEIRFHTLVLSGGETQAIATDTLFREGENVGRKSSARIGASAAGGAIIGAIFGGEKGAAIGAAAGAGAGTAATAAQRPSEARFRAGAVVTVRLTAPVSITVQQ
jgi:hypothetical protein